LIESDANPSDLYKEEAKEEARTVGAVLLQVCIEGGGTCLKLFRYLASAKESEDDEMATHLGVKISFLGTVGGKESGKLSPNS
jgi:hypothetical protein